MAEQNGRPEKILVFDDDDITISLFQDLESELNQFVEQNHIEWNGGFGWHEDWRASGHGRICTLSDTKIEAQTRFEAAYTFCHNESIHGICFFDFSLKGVSVKSMDNWESIRTELEPQLQDMVVKYPGLLLAIAMAKNPRADVDIWLATSSPETVEVLIDPLRELTGETFEVCSKGSLTKQSYEQLIQLLKLAINKYVRTRSPDEIENLFWPDHAANWFNAAGAQDEKSVPHNRPSNERHGAFTKLTEYAKAIAGYGKIFNGVDKVELPESEIVVLNKWVSSEAGYEALKSFVGHCSPCSEGHHPNTHQLKLSAFTIPLLAAVGPGHWFEEVPWDELKSFETRILVKDKACCRAAILSAFKFFRTLQTHSKNKKLNDFVVRFSPARSKGNKKDSLAYLDVSVSFFDPKFLSRLSGGSVEPEDNIEAGDSTLAFRNLKESLRNTGLGPFTHLWVFPETVENMQRTVIRFGVYDSDKYAN